MFGGPGPVNYPNFSHFTALETLHVSTSPLLREDPRIAMAKLSAPLLRFLSLNFSPQDQHCESLNSFGPEQARWLTDFAASKASFPDSGLKEIHIQYGPDMELAYLYPGFPDDMPWPWDYIKQAQGGLLSHGLTLTCTTPITRTKQQWLEQWEGQKREREADLVGKDENAEEEGAGSSSSE